MLFRANQERYRYQQCANLNIPQSTYYYISKKINEVDPIIADAIEIFNKSRKNYGTRKIKHQLEAKGIVASWRRIGRIMWENGLVSNYTVAHKVHKQPVNLDPVPNEVNRNLMVAPLKWLSVDRSYVQVGGKMERCLNDRWSLQSGMIRLQCWPNKTKTVGLRSFCQDQIPVGSSDFNFSYWPGKWI